tara:strand:- start:234 stop:1580 length:1347 start_codon:yes stop_codon:yes gene_type:complete
MLILSFNHKKELTEILVNKKLLFLFLILSINHCSFSKNSSFWNPVNIEKDDNKKELFKKVEITNFEINNDLEITIESSKFSIDSFHNNLTNNNGRIDYEGKLRKAEKYSFRKIAKFDEYEPEIIFDKQNIIFFSNKGNILKFDNKSKLIWKKNYYTKEEKKLNPILFFAKSKNTLIVADSVAKLYALDIKTGELLWSKNNSSAFNSEIKIYKDRLFIVDYENILRSFHIKNGLQIWKVQTDNTIFKSQKKLSIIIKDKKVIFNNSIGDITAVNIDSGNLQWFVPTLKNTNSSTAYLLKMSNLVSHKDSVYFSTNMNEFYSLDINNGIINWVQNINSNLKPTIIDNIIFSISNEGYLNILNTINGSIIRRTDLFSKFKIKKKKKIKPTGFVVGKNKIYISLNNGRILIADVATGKTISLLKITKNYISRPFVSNENLFVIKNNGIIKIQ